jgi:hypothetical protein
MKVEHSGWYRTKNGSLAEVLIGARIFGHVVNLGVSPVFWTMEGASENCSSIYNLIEYLGKERPKQRKTVKMAPALFKSCSLTNPGRKDGFFVTDQLYSSEEHARKDFPFSLVRWLIDTHAIEVGVEE